MNHRPLDESYLEWLYSQVADADARNPSLTYWKLLRQLYSREFVWLVPNDNNRLEDGKDLRLEFLRETGETADRDWSEMGCSVLELMVGLARKLAFECFSGEPHYWFWHLMENIGLHEYSDDVRPFPRDEIDSVLEVVIQRLYEPNGRGGFFPLSEPPSDQRREELWYQLGHYVLENDY